MPFATMTTTSFLADVAAAPVVAFAGTLVLLQGLLNWTAPRVSSNLYGEPKPDDIALNAHGGGAATIDRARGKKARREKKGSAGRTRARPGIGHARAQESAARAPRGRPRGRLDVPGSAAPARSKSAAA